jgi:DNA helicase-2/ATP-dependent DNA helicase PcrA
MDQKNAISVVKLFELLLSKTGILPLSLSSNEIVAELQLMHTFLDFINEETHRKSKFTLTELLNTVSMMKQHGIGIPLNKSISASNGVLLTTAHSSKGLEFQYVFMVNCTEENWNSKIKKTNQFYLPEVLTSTNEETNGEEGQRRLFYVAMTRAKEFLHISYPVNSKKGRVKFIEEILELSLVDCIQKSQPLDEAIKSHVALLQVADTTELRSRNTEFIKERLSNFYLTPSSLNRYIDCPYTFYYEQVLAIPSPQSDKLSFGNAIHGALEKMSRIYNKTSILPPISLLIETFHFQMDNMRYLFSPERFRQLSEIGEKDLIGFYNNVMTEWTAAADTEIAYRNGTIDGIPVAGKIDRIEYLNDGSVNIIDFKTGTYDKKYALAISAAKPLGGSYRRQLLFYKLMFEQHITGGKPVNEVCLQYTRADYDGVFPKVNAQIGEEEIALFKTLIKDIWEKINKLEFENGCNSTDCKWCNFVKNNIAPNDFNNPDIDDLDDEG